MVEIHVTAETEYLDASLSFIEQHTEKKHKYSPVLLISGRITKRVVYISPEVTDIHFTPAEQLTFLNINSLKFVKLTTSSALKQMHKKLLTYRPDNNYNYTLQLWGHYEQLFKQQQKSEADYNIWLEKREPSLLKQQYHINTAVCFTVIIEISNNLDEAIILNKLNSIESQTYLSWSLILIKPDTPLTSTIDAAIQKLDSKVSVTLRRNSHDKIQQSDLITHASGDYFLHLASDSILSKHALSIFARHINENIEDSIMYADHDSIHPNGIRINPIFKPDWNPDLALSNNYIGETVVIHKKLLESMPDLLVDQCSTWIYEQIVKSAMTKNNLTHISLILSHVAYQAAKDKKNKGKKQLAVLQSHLKTQGAKAVLGRSSMTFRVIWPMKNPLPLVSIIIPTRDGLITLKRTIDSLFTKTKYTNYEVLIVDNQSKKNETKEYLRSLSTRVGVRILTYDKPFNYSAINNYAASHARGSILTLLNNDIEVISPDWLLEMASHAQRSDIGCVGAMLYYPDNRIQHAGVIIGLGGCAGHSHKFYKRNDKGYTNRLLCTQNYSAVTGACLVLRKSVFEEARGLNENNLSVAFNDVDLCLKVKALGYRNLWTPWAELFHYESLSRGKDDTKEKRLRLNKEVAYMKDTWKTTSTVDPYYSRFLTRIREDFSLGL
jgi:GT2 family glycosyltransferase